MNGIVTQGMGGAKLATQGFGSAVTSGPLGTTLNIAVIGVRGDNVAATGNRETTATEGGRG